MAGELLDKFLALAEVVDGLATKLGEIETTLGDIETAIGDLASPPGDGGGGCPPDPLPY